MKISAVIITKNEEENILACINCLRFCDETIVVDDFSQDKTIEIVKKTKAKVFKRRLNSDFSAQRNFGLEKAQGEWVLFVDADEKVSKELANEIVKVIESDKFDGVFLKRKDYLWGKDLKYGETAKVSLLRLGKRGKGKWKRRVHEVWDIEGKTTYLSNFLRHYPHPNLRNFLTKVNDYSSLHAQEKYFHGQRSNLLKIVVYPLGKLFNNWLIKLGFLDGTHGLVFGLAMSFHSFLAWSKLWLYQKKN